MNCVYVFIIVALQYFVNDVRADFSCEVPCTPWNTPHDVPDYYWKEYDGLIPEDAVPGGHDKSGNPTYIGQVLYTKQSDLLPATIYSGCKSALATEGGKQWQSDKNVKILCSKYLNKLKWVVIKNGEAHLPTNCHLVKGGFEINQLYIGRVHYNDQTIIGKVFLDHPSYRGLWVPNDEGGDTRFLTYQILTYNCERHEPQHHGEHFSFTDFVTQKSE